jgi:hypothetical protein
MSTMTADQRDTTPMHQPTTVPGRVPARGILRAGMTIMEVMVSFAVIAIAIASMLGAIGNLASTRNETADVILVNQALLAMVDRIQAAKEGSVGSGMLAPRFLDTVAGSNPPLSESATDDEDNLVFNGVISYAPGLNLRIYIEYYRAVAGLDSAGNIDSSKPGLMQGEDPAATSSYTKPSDFSVSLATAASRARFRLDPNLDLWDQVGEQDPVVIRLVAVYALPREPDRDRSIEFITGRKK